MGVVIGMDEAGYGPNLGPLVVTTTVWEVDGSPHDFNFWREFKGVIAQKPPSDHSHVQIADSKEVHSSAKGVGALEIGVLCALALQGEMPQSLRGIWERVAAWPETDDCEPWFDGGDLELPHACHDAPLERFIDKWRERCEKRRVRLRQVRSDIVMTRRFNRLTQTHDSKGIALSRISLNLLGEVWNLAADEPTLVICDKHGGRNRYDTLLQEIAGDEFILRMGEGMERSVYRVRQAEVCFQTRAEEHFPVALASMVSKYLREVTMILFNRFWEQHVPDLRWTKGYPGDSSRFRADIAQAQSRLGIPDELVWRER